MGEQHSSISIVTSLDSDFRDDTFATKHVDIEK